MSYNDIGDFPPEFFDDLVNLRDLRLIGNKIVKIDTDLFANLEKLEVSFSCRSYAHNLTARKVYDLRIPR